MESRSKQSKIDVGIFYNVNVLLDLGIIEKIFSSCRTWV